MFFWKETMRSREPRGVGVLGASGRVESAWKTVSHHLSFQRGKESVFRTCTLSVVSVSSSICTSNKRVLHLLLVRHTNQKL